MQQSDQQVTINFDYLKPPATALTGIKHDKDYIKKNKRSKSQRRIWENVPYDDYEQEKIQELIKEIAKDGIVLPPDWTDADILKMCYISKFKAKNYSKNVKAHIEWRQNPINHTPTEINVAFLQKGIIYTLGRDKQYRPVIIMNLELVNLKQFPEEQYISALSFFLGLIKSKCFVPGLIENWIFIIDTKKLGLTQFPFKALSSAIGTMQTNFCGCLEKLFILNPSSSLSFSWKMISALGDPDSMAKISFRKPKEYSKMQEKIPANQLEQQYGGTVPDLKRFWPPINLEIPGGYPEDVLKAADSMKVAQIEIQVEKPVSEEEEAKLAAQMQQMKIPAQEEDEDEA